MITRGCVLIYDMFPLTTRPVRLRRNLRYCTRNIIFEEDMSSSLVQETMMLHDLLSVYGQVEHYSHFFLYIYTYRLR